MIKLGINLSELKHVIMTKKGQSGDVKGIFIPLEVNHLEQNEKNGNVYLNMVAFEMKEPKDWADHIIKQSLPKEVREAMTDEEKKNEPILGNLKTGENAVSSGAVSVEVDEDDDLPF